MLYAFDEIVEVSYTLNDKIFGMDLPVMKISSSALLQRDSPMGKRQTVGDTVSTPRISMIKYPSPSLRRHHNPSFLVAVPTECIPIKTAIPPLSRREV